VDEAEQLMRRALAIDEANFAADHPRLANGLSNLALLLHETGRKAATEPQMRRALASYIQRLGAEHLLSQGVRSHYISLLQAMGKTGHEIRADLAILIA